MLSEICSFEGKKIYWVNRSGELEREANFRVLNFSLLPLADSLMHTNDLHWAPHTYTFPTDSIGVTMAAPNPFLITR